MAVGLGRLPLLLEICPIRVHLLENKWAFLIRLQIFFLFVDDLGA